MLSGLALVVLGALCTAFTLPASAAESFGYAAWQNDLFIGQDGGGYSNGLYLSRLRVASAGENTIEPPSLMRPLVEGLGLPRPTLTALSIGQIMVTPRDITKNPPDSTDAPYIGALLVRSTYVTVHGPSVHMLALNVGVIGPASGAEQVQRFSHKVTGSREPRGWDTQVSNRGLFGIEGATGWRAAWRNDSGGPGADAIAIGQGVLGNLQSSVGTTLLLRYGRGLDRSYPTTPRILSQRGDPMLLEDGWFTFAAFSYDRIALHAGIEDGGSQRARLRKNSLRGTAGLAYGWKDSSLTLSVARDSALVEAGQPHSYASLSYTWQLR